MKRNFQFALLVMFALVVFSCKNKKAEEATVNEAADVAKTEQTMGKSLTVDGTASKVMWIGSKPTGSHNGTIDVASGSVNVENGKITGGSVVLNMASITVSDLEGEEKTDLEAHLKGTNEGTEDHFFNVVQFPTAKFEITNVKGLEGTEGANSLVYGNLTMKGITKEVGFKAMVDVSDAGVMVSSPNFTINRTDWGVNYGSKSVFDNLKDKFINDDIELSLTLSAK